MGVAVTFRNQAKHERRSNKRHDSLFCKSEAEPLPHLLQFVVLLQAVLSIATELSH